MSAELINIVLDLETLGVREDSAIIQIGACVPKFDQMNHLQMLTNAQLVIVGQRVAFEFEATIRYEECLHSVFTVDNRTMEWWEKQPVRTQVFSGQDSYPDAFDAFTKWIDSFKVPVAIWGNSPSFDCDILKHSMNACGFKPPWEFRNERCLRTAFALAGVHKGEYGRLSGVETEHTAIGDARFEARVLDSVYRNHSPNWRI